ncbi:ERB1 protein, partial [Sylvietta virens]|nr:ERB1 protein [Sylvietta virens]
SPWYTFNSVNSYCGSNTTSKSPQSFGCFGMENIKNRMKLWNNGTPKVLPPNVFLICGDHAWQGIPSNVFGGPCYLGKLSLLAPSMRQWLNMTIADHVQRQKRSLGLTPKCNDKVELTSVAARTLLVIFPPRAAAGNALNNFAGSACWAEKQAYATTMVIEELVMDQNSLRHAILQNRAAVDFLLLTQGHGCEDLEGMCCMNLSDHSESIHKKLQYLQQHIQSIQKEQGLFGNWLNNCFGNIPNWLKELIIESLRFCGYLLMFILVGCLALS